jgi:hypothetical protein
MTIIAYTADAAYMCPPCALARYGQEPGRSWVREDATDSESNPVHPVFGLDEWCEPSEPGLQSLVCDSCAGVIATCQHDEPPCECENCRYSDGAESAESDRAALEVSERLAMAGEAAQ